MTDTLEACRAREKVLRDVLIVEANIYMENDPEDGPPDHITDALFIPTDDTALRAALAAERERCVVTLRNMGDGYFNDSAEAKTLDECVNAIRELGDPV